MRNKRAIIFFDGVCSLCSRSVQFILKNNSNKSFYFASLQGEVAKSLGFNNMNSIVYKKENELFYKTDAVIEILLQLDGFYPRLALVIKFFPKKIRDFFYDQLAKFRYDLFGKLDQCYLPRDEDRELFLD